jgi:HTH-like domain
VRHPIARGCELMRTARSTYYGAPTEGLNDTALVAAMATICDEFEAYGWRRGRAELRHRGIVANHKRIRRLMREQGLQPDCGDASSPRPRAATTARSFQIWRRK